MTDENHTNRSDRAERLRRMRDQRTSTDSGPESDAEASTESPDGASDEHSVETEDSETANEDDGADASEAVDTRGEPGGDGDVDDPGATDDGESPEDTDGEGTPEEIDAAGESDGEQRRTHQIIEFELGDDRYGIDIMRADEVLAYREVTRVPNTPDLIRGVVDIRGQIITVIDPTTVFNPRGQADGDGLIVVFEVELVDGVELIGWAVDNVLSVHTVKEEEIVEPPKEDTTVETALEREDGYLSLTTPESLLAATGEFGSKLADSVESEINVSA